MKVILARIGFMKFYQGPKPGDEKPIGGGSYNTGKIGHEAYNYIKGTAGYSGTPMILCGVQRDAHDFMRFSFYFWSFGVASGTLVYKLTW